MTKVEDFKKRNGIITDIYTEKEYGFIHQEDGMVVFFHANGVCIPSFEHLREGYRVEYMTTAAKKGLKAIGVSVI